MAMSIPLDTLDYAKKLETTGMPVAQAEQQSKLLADVLGKAVTFPRDLLSSERNLLVKIDAAKADIEAKLGIVKMDLEGKLNVVKADIEDRLGTVKMDLESKIDGVKSDITLIKWMMGTLIALNSAMIIKLLFA